MNKYIVVDIETAADPNLSLDYEAYYLESKKDKRLTDPIKIKANFESLKQEYALSPRTGKIIMIGYYLFDGENGSDEIHSELYMTEKEMLEKFWREIKNYVVQNGCKLVTKNGKTFDLPFIFFRSLLYDIEGVPQYAKMVSQYNTDYHVDLANFLPGKLIELSHLLLNEPLDKEDGSAIAEMYRNSQWDEIVAKNKTDLETTAKIYEKIQSYIM